MQKLDKDPNTIIRTPIFLDATCSGIQHLAGLLLDLELGSNVNLVEYTDTEKPGDIYEKIVDPINKAFNKIGLDNINYANLAKIKLSRKILK